MAERDIDLAMIERLVRSSAWREYRDQVLLVDYHRVSQSLDVVQGDHRYYQGLKEGLRRALEQPYVLLDLPSPLVKPEAPARVPARVAARERADAQDAVPMSLARPSYLA
jgi:hypothetical protein